ncbi:MAG: polyribonucleotide nucleotidyltransferase [Candidatus Coatesbacteria bacterium]|nr:polyribonucleotide nucleotidyltransferase [Candidatus Coatesbacteria bacterium]
MHSIQTELGGRTLFIETGRIARQTDGAAWVRYGDTIALITVVSDKEPPRELRDFFPLTVEYREKTYAAGKIPGGFFKREGKPREKEILSSRLIDRPIRPLFPEGFFNDVQIVVSILSSDMENDGDILGIIGSSIALNISCIPFEEVISAVRIGRLGGSLVLNPTFSQIPYSDINIVVVATDDAIIMVEGEMREVSEDDLVDAINFAHDEIRKINKIQKEFISNFDTKKMEYVNPFEQFPELKEQVSSFLEDKLPALLDISDKNLRKQEYKRLLSLTREKFKNEEENNEKIISYYFERKMHSLIRNMLFKDKKRIGNRGFSEIRPIDIMIGVLPRAHGSSIFTRGETQALVTTTLGTVNDRQLIDDLEGESWKSYMLHYNFPAFSVGEIGGLRGPGRREIGHGNLAERALAAVIPAEEIFPYTIRIVSEILESNGSSSMATVCGASMALMDAGVPIKSPVAGVSIGLLKDNNDFITITDIIGDEDHHGDMDFKVAGTEDGITAIQLDIKIKGINEDILRCGIKQARDAHFKIISIMKQTLDKPRAELSEFAPQILSFDIDNERIGEVIGQGGRSIRSIIETTGTEINIEDDGKVTISSMNKENNLRAKEIIENILAVPELGKIYTGKVKKIATFGAFVEFLPNQEGLVHISQLADKKVAKVEDVINVGDEIKVKIIKIDEQKGVSLSYKEAIREIEANK